MAIEHARHPRDVHARAGRRRGDPAAPRALGPTVGYEQARGLRQKHQRPDGFSVSASRTLGVPIERAYDAFADATTRDRWLPDAAFTVRRSTPPKSLRITWIDGATRLEVNLHPKEGGRSQVSVQHSKLPDADAAARMKAYWGEALDRLRKTLER